MNLEDAVAQRKAERDITNPEKLESQRRRRLVDMTTKLIQEVTETANARSALLPILKKK